MQVETISIEEVRLIAFKLAKQFVEWDEPIPDFKERYEGVLESCLQQPFQRFGGNDLYPSLIDKSSILFYLMIKNHPFSNGNKRIAIFTLTLFLYKNNKWIYILNDDLYNFAKDVAQSESKLKDETILLIKKLLLGSVDDADLLLS